MSMKAKLKTVQKCSGVTFEEIGKKIGCSKQNVQQRLNRRLYMRPMLDFLAACGFWLTIKSPDGDIVIKITDKDYYEDL